MKELSRLIKILGNDTEPVNYGYHNVIASFFSKARGNVTIPNTDVSRPVTKSRSVRIDERRPVDI